MMDKLGEQIFSTLLALALVGGLAWVCLALLKRFQEGRATRPGARPEATLRFVRAMPVGPKERVVLVHYRGEALLLGVTPGGMDVLARHLIDADVPAATSDKARSGRP